MALLQIKIKSNSALLTDAISKKKKKILNKIISSIAIQIIQFRFKLWSKM